MGNVMINKLPILSGPEFGPASGLKPKQLVILCHGLGADGNDLIGLAPYYAQVLPDAKYKDKIITRFMNGIMLDGKKSKAEKIIYGAFEIINNTPNKENITPKT